MIARRTLLAGASILEAATGLALIASPAMVSLWLLGEDLTAAALTVGRVAGFGLTALGIACWPRSMGLLPALRAMLVYNLLAAAYFVRLWLGGQLVGILLLPALVLHALLAALLLRSWWTFEADEDQG